MDQGKTGITKLLQVEAEAADLVKEARECKCGPVCVLSVFLQTGQSSSVRPRMLLSKLSRISPKDFTKSSLTKPML